MFDHLISPDGCYSRESPLPCQLVGAGPDDHITCLAGPSTGGALAGGDDSFGAVGAGVTAGAGVPVQLMTGPLSPACADPPPLLSPLWPL
jgi:hypothetical protein